jgi:hypothetical protein
MALHEYKIALGSNQPAGSLVNIEDVTNVKRPPRHTPIAYAPVKSTLLNGNTRRDGRNDFVWKFDSLPDEGFQQIIASYLTSSGTVVGGTTVTVNTYDVRAGTYIRANAYLNLPLEDVDYTYEGGYVQNLQLRFTKLVKL